MEKARIQVLIPAWNNADDIEATISSVWQQDYDNDSIWITAVDFGSEDGTYEKLMKYDKYHFGVYRMERPYEERLIVSYAMRQANEARPGGAYSYVILLYPGEILYPDCLRKCTEACLKYQYLRPSMVICETDIKMADGSVREQKPLYEAERIIDGKTEMTEFMNKGYQHQIFEMKNGFGTGKYKANGENNEARFWNKAARGNHEMYAVYLPDVLACTKEINYKDELEEILHRWEAIISMIRFYESKYDNAFDTAYAAMAKKNVAEYALWRCYKLYCSGGTGKDMEDCFMISGVILPEICNCDIYRKMERLLRGEEQALPEIRDYFEAAE